MARLKFPNPDSLEVHLSILGRSIWGADHSGRGIQSVFPSGSASSHVCFSLCSPQVETSLYRFLEKAWEEASQGLRRRGGVQAQTWITDLRCFPACLIPQDFFLSRVECFSIWKCHKEIKCSLFKTTGTSMTTESLSLLPSSLSSAFRGGPLVIVWKDGITVSCFLLSACTSVFLILFFLMPPDTPTLCSLNSQGIFESEFLFGCYERCTFLSWGEGQVSSLHHLWCLSTCGSCMM